MTGAKHDAELALSSAAPGASATVPQGSEARRIARQDGSGCLDLDIPKRGGAQKKISGIAACRRSTGPPVRLSSVRTVKGPLSRTQSLEPGTRIQGANRVVVRRRSKEVQPTGVDHTENLADATCSSVAFGHIAADDDRSSGSVQTGLGSDRSRSEGRCNESRSLSGSRDFRSRVTPTTAEPSWPPQAHRHMSTTEAYFGRVPVASADFQRLLGFRGQEGQHLSTEALVVAAGGRRNVKNSGLSQFQQRDSTGSHGGLGRGHHQEVTGGTVSHAGGPETESTNKAKRGKSKRHGSSSKTRNTRGTPLEYTEAATAVRAMAAAQASAAAAATARAANAGPVPAWRQQQIAAAKDQKISISRSSTLRKGLSFPITLLAKVKAKFTRSKSDG